ncbi:MAG: SDR family oxidoreductase [Halobacteriovoraceae bacterium]|jgi:NAD(P)-dependent dehydrogenase (short-subunit alcohol dehydrogenase family)|nr:SDR family oxidoreductase [Halobacteriovoraceae bacterium]
MPVDIGKVNFALKGQTALITGAGGILAEYFTAGLARAGANIALIDINDQVINERAKMLSTKYDVSTYAHTCDITKKDSVSSMVQAVSDNLGDITILHNNAAAKPKDLTKYFAPYEEYSLDVWKDMMAVNIDGMFLVSQAVGKHMISHGKGGSIIQTASIYGVNAPDQRIYEGSDYMGGPINTPAVYSASKAAVVGLTKYLATYWAEKNIRVNCLTPGGVESGQNETFKQKYSARIPLGRMAEAQEMVGALIYLASSASSYVTGQNIMIDGGLNAW